MEYYCHETSSTTSSTGACSDRSSSQTSSPDLSKYQDMSCVTKLFFGENIPLLKTRERSNSGTIFDHRRDFSAFNVLPGSKINSYHIKMEDESSHGNDDIRNFILSSLSKHGINRTKCILCQEYIQVYDKYPLIDGTFFLSPRQYSSSGSVPVTLKSPILASSSLLSMTSSSNETDTSLKLISKQQSGASCKKSTFHCNNGGGAGHSKNGTNHHGKNNSGHQRCRANSKSSGSSRQSIGSSSNESSDCGPTNQQFLQAVCMSCLEGWNFRIECLKCRTPWRGSNLTLGSMYSYDIFAALPCCVDRYNCNRCDKPIIRPDRRLDFFSDYSQQIPCPSCGLRDHHFVKPLGLTFTRSI